MLHLILVLAGVCTMGMALPLPDFYSYSTAVGYPAGSQFSTAHDGRITGIRVWEYTSFLISGLQVGYDGNWTDVVGVSNGGVMEMTLLDNEFIVQVSGKYEDVYHGYIFQLIFVTNHGRMLKVGQPYGTSFNFYPTHDGSELRFLSGRRDGYGINAIGAHWDVY